MFTEWHERFYVGRHKVVPEAIAAWLTPLSMAVWLMDDGGADSAGLDIQTHSFELGEVERLVVALAERFDVRARTRANKGRWIIYLPSSQVESLRSIVEPHFLSELRYKLVPRRERTP